MDMSNMFTKNLSLEAEMIACKEHRHGAHTVFEIRLHVGWITKYRRSALTGEVVLLVWELIREICGQHEVTILKGHVSKDYVRLAGVDSP